MWQCPECLHSLRWSLNRSTQPKPGEPSICGWCAAFVIFNRSYLGEIQGVGPENVLLSSVYDGQGLISPQRGRTNVAE